MNRRVAWYLGFAALSTACAPVATSLAETEDERLLGIIKLRHERMKNDLGGALNLIDDEINTVMADRAKIAKAAQTILAQSKEIPAWFPKGTGPETGWGLAKSEIWEQPEAFKTATTRMIDAAGKLVQAVQGGQLADITARFEAAAAECSGCHKAFRIPPS